MQYVQAAAQIRQVQIGQQQVWQLSQLNAQLQMQQRAAAFQANLGQALFETEQMAKRVAATLRHDLFAAAILSHYWWQTISGIRPDHFTDVHSKRAWADAAQILTSTQQRGQMDPGTSLAVNQYLMGMEQFRGLRAIVGENPDSFLAHAETTAKRSTDRAATLMQRAIVVGTGAAAALIVILVANATKSEALGFFWLVFLGLCALSFYLGKEWMDASTNGETDRSKLARAKQAVAEYEAFKADPNRGMFLQRAWTDHPLLFNEPIPEVPAPGQAAAGVSVQTYVERQLVERQVVVTRCKFCQQMTPVDGHTCQHCGAPGFGG